jgi:hypothetical protein
MDEAGCGAVTAGASGAGVEEQADRAPTSNSMHATFSGVTTRFIPNSPSLHKAGFNVTVDDDTLLLRYPNRQEDASWKTQEFYS